MINERMARAFAAQAEVLLEESAGAAAKQRHNRVLRLAQESFELSLKACLRAVGIEYPKEHEVSDVLEGNPHRFPKWFQAALPLLTEGSAWLAEKRGPAMYGDEVKGIEASALFTKNDGEKALHYARTASSLCERLLTELFSAQRP